MNRNRALVLALVGVVVLQASWIAALSGAPSNGPVPPTPADTGPGGERSLSPTFAGSSTESSGVIPAYDPTSRAGTLVSFRIDRVDSPGLYVDVANVSQRTSFQASLRHAAMAADRLRNRSKTDGYLVTLDTPDEWRYVSGESGGLMLTLGILATRTGFELRDGVVATGVVTERGVVGRVDEVRAKAAAARNAGFDAILVPPGQYVDVDGIEVVEVANVSEAANRSIVGWNRGPS